MSRLARFIQWSGMLDSYPQQVAVAAGFIWVLTFAVVVAILVVLWVLLGEHFGGGIRDIAFVGCLWATGYTVMFLFNVVRNDILGAD